MMRLNEGIFIIMNRVFYIYNLLFGYRQLTLYSEKLEYVPALNLPFDVGYKVNNKDKLMKKIVNKIRPKVWKIFIYFLKFYHSVIFIVDLKYLQYQT